MSQAVHYKIPHLDKTNGLVRVKWAGEKEVMACETQMCSPSHMKKVIPCGILLSIAMHSYAPGSYGNIPYVSVLQYEP